MLKSAIKGALACTLLLACAQVPQENLQDAYVSESRKLGLYPIYPPREGFQVGDIYLASVRRDNINDLEYVWAGEIPEVRVAANEFLKSRVVFRDTSTSSNNQLPSTLAAQTDMFEAGVATRNTQPSDSLPVVAFPSISGDAGFTGSAGITGVLQSIGIGGGTRTTVTLDFVDVRSFWLPKVKASAFKSRMLAPEIFSGLESAYDDLQRQVFLNRRPEAVAGPQRCISLALITRVYMTRRIDYTYRNANILGVGLRRSEVPGQQSNVAAAPDVTINLSQTGSGNLADDTAADVEALNRNIDSFNGSNTQGRSLSFQSWDGRGLRFAQTFQRPVVIGWDGYDVPPPKYDAARDRYIFSDFSYLQNDAINDQVRRNSKVRTAIENICDINKAVRG